ncbi:hypothetical protein CIK05_15380 [Bdellovibrio sp. qaytius]|nr:hypothetical protein CIK05_15380 [Bdellovibrio sp. qaytius]
MKWLTFILIAAFAHNTYAAGTCENIDLRDQLGPVLNQDGTGLCYAYSAADIISFKLGRRVSPVDIALQYTKSRDELMLRGAGDKYLNQIEDERKKDIFQGGWVRYALQYNSQIGFCADEKVNSNNFSTNRGLYKGLVNLNQLGLHQFNLDSASAGSCAKFAEIQKIFPGVSMRELQDVANRSTLIDTASNVADKACEPRIKPSTPMRFTNLHNESSPSEILRSSDFDDIDRVLSKKQPVSVSIFMDKIYNFGKSSINKQPRHAITLAGKKFNSATGKCEYILKNSWGPECDRYYKVRCENGYLFVPEDVFKSSVYGADYID